MRENFIILDQFDLVKMINQRIHRNTDLIVDCNMAHNTSLIQHSSIIKRTINSI